MHPRSNVENQILKAGFTSRDIVIMENDDPGGVFEFSPSSRGPWLINVSFINLKREYELFAWLKYLNVDD